ncbi:hypothetical protein AAJP47_08705 [Psychrobacter sp. B38]|uniref:hypothetical protein n=1 Tax=Psychrobacter sp. B38 TaxID=3143538 RepID=UPI00320E70CC
MVPVKDTDLAQDIVSPPPTNQNLNSDSGNTDGHNNKWAWGIAASAFFLGAIGVIAWGIAVVFSFIDYKKFKEKDIEISPKWMVFIPIFSAHDKKIIPNRFSWV